MAFLATARKYRPQTFAELVGQDHISKTLSNAIINNRISHAYLFSGPRGVGKTSAARILAKSINCETGSNPSPCGICSNCREITQGNSIDVFEIDGASNRGIEQIRELRESVRFSPTKSRYKIYIIDEVHMLTTEAFNALLKTLEEPPSHVMFIFATTEPAKVKVTIRSRCQHYRFKRIHMDMIISHLKKICDAEGVNYSDKALFWLARAGDGSMRDSQSLLDQVVSFSGNQISENDVRTIAGIIDSEIYFNFITLLLEKDFKSLLKMAAELDDEGVDFYTFITGLSEIIRNLAYFKEGGDPSRIEMMEEEKKKLLTFVDDFSTDDLINLMDMLILLGREIHNSRNPRRVFELNIFHIISFRNKIKPEQILMKIESLYSRLAGNNGGPKDNEDSETSSDFNIELTGQNNTNEVKNINKAASKSVQQPPEDSQSVRKADIEPDRKSVETIKEPAPQKEQPVSNENKVQNNIQPSSGKLLNELIQYEDIHNPLAAAVLKEATRANIDEVNFTIYYHKKNSFHLDQVEHDLKDQIAQFIEERTGKRIRVRALFEEMKAPVNHEKKLASDISQTGNNNIEQREDENIQQKKTNNSNDKIVSNVLQTFNGEIIE